VLESKRSQARDEEILVALVKVIVAEVLAGHQSLMW
jgi:hypothetical protein